MEIERKFLIDHIPFDLSAYPFHLIEQAYLNVNPVVRVRRSDQDYILTYKGAGLMSREEYNLPLTRESYHHLLSKADGTVITKHRYLIPLGSYTIELDQFHGEWEGLTLAEIEFSSEDEALSFSPPQWFGEDVTFNGHYHNSWMSQHKRSDHYANL